MAKNLNTLLLMRRAYSATVENVVKLRPTATIMRKVVAEPVETISPAKEVFWMRDPKTGNWIPENHFGEVDAVDLRNKFLSKKTPAPDQESIHNHH